jgi:hypothetical protein
MEARRACPQRLHVAPFFPPMPCRPDRAGRPERCGRTLLQPGPQGGDGGPRWLEERLAGRKELPEAAAIRAPEATIGVFQGMGGFPPLLGAQLLRQGDHGSAAGLVGFHEDTGGERIAFGLGKAPQRADIILLRHVRKGAHHGGPDRAHSAGFDAEVLHAMLPRHRAEDHGRTGRGRICLALKQPGGPRARCYLQEGIEGRRARGRADRHKARVEIVRPPSRHRGDEGLQRRRRWPDHLPLPADGLSAGQQGTGQPIVCGPLGEALGEAPPGLRVEGVPSALEADTLSMVRLGRQSLGAITQEHQRERQGPRELSGHGDGRSHRLGEEPPIGAERTELDRTAAALALAAPLGDRLWGPTGYRPGLRQCRRTGVCG